MSNRAHLIVDQRRALLRLEKLDQAAANTAQPMRTISHKLGNSVDLNFEKGGRFDRAGVITGGSKTWPVKQDGSRSYLQASGVLRRSILPESTNDTATVATNIQYAARHNFGERLGPRSSLLTRAMTKTKGTPARPFMVVQDADVAEATKIIRAHLLGGVR